jgi:2-polyprenyl-3-methyl-5-hydroxy-6-metoxy-1,4-benzoquinol methylase
MKSILINKKKAVLLKTIDTKQIAAKWKKNLSIDVGDKFKKLKKINYWYCQTTGFRWYEPKEAAGGSELYEQLGKYDWYYMKDKWEFNRALNLINKKSKILEIGSGEGHFLRIAKNRNYCVEGLELNSKSAARMRSKGFKIHELLLNDLNKKTGEHYDFICSFQVLEHIPNPLEFIKDAMGLLIPGGKIIFSVPNGELMRKIDKDNDDLLNQPPHHMGHWDINVFLSLEKILPLKINSVHYEPLANYHAAWIIVGYLRNKLSFLGIFRRLLINRYSTLPLQLLVKMGFKVYIPGHTLLVELVKKKD